TTPVFMAIARHHLPCSPPRYSRRDAVSRPAASGRAPVRAPRPASSPRRGIQFPGAPPAGRLPRTSARTVAPPHTAPSRSARRPRTWRRSTPGRPRRQTRAPARACAGSRPAWRHSAPPYRLPHDVAEQKGDVRRALGEPPHEIGVPVAPKRDVDPHVVALAAQAQLEVAAHAVQHLELEALGRDAGPAGEGFRVRDDPGVMRGDSGIVPALEQPLHAADVVRVHVALVRKRDRRRLLICALAQPHAAMPLALSPWSAATAASTVSPATKRAARRRASPLPRMKPKMRDCSLSHRRPARIIRCGASAIELRVSTRLLL